MQAYSIPERKREVGENGSYESQEDDGIYTLSTETVLHGGGNACVHLPQSNALHLPAKGISTNPSTPYSPEKSHRVQNFNSEYVGQLFGMAEVHIRVPEEWPSHFRHRSMSPHQYFQEMSPIFCTSEVLYDVIGSHMQEHFETSIFLKTCDGYWWGGGSMSARQILLVTPLLQWYLKHGLQVTKIYKTIE